jgi:hypothetical protein
MFKSLVEDEDFIFPMESEELKYKFYNTIFPNEEFGIYICKNSLSSILTLNELKISDESFLTDNKKEIEENLTRSIFYEETLNNINNEYNKKNNSIGKKKEENEKLLNRENLKKVNNESIEDINFLFQVKNIGEIEEKPKSIFKHSSISSTTDLISKNSNDKNYIFKISKRKSKYNILSKEQKKKILKDLKFYSTKYVSSKYNVSIRNLVRWKKLGIERKKGSGRKYKDPYLENKMLKYYYENDKITTKQFREKAKELCSDSSFKASTGWLMRIKRKFNLVFVKY